MEIGMRIKELRVGKNLTQEALAEKLQVSRQAVAKWESGQSMPSMANLLTLCGIFGVSLQQLTAEKPAGEEPIAKRHWVDRVGLKVFLVIVSVIFSLVSVISLVDYSNFRLPENVIGYADVRTEIYILGTPVYLYLLCGLAVALSAFTVVVFIWSNRRKGRSKK